MTVDAADVVGETAAADNVAAVVDAIELAVGMAVPLVAKMFC